MRGSLKIRLTGTGEKKRRINDRLAIGDLRFDIPNS